MQAKSALKKIVVDIYSDIACPWCYVGKRKFIMGRDDFLKSHSEYSVQVNWRAYMIDPATKQMGEEYLAYNKRRWGGDGWTHDLREAGKKVGCNFANWKTWPNTLLAHCVVTGAQKVNKAEDALNEIFALCYEEGKNISDPKVLEGVASKVGINEEWKSEEIRKEVIEEDAYAKNTLDIRGVPYFIFNQKGILEGAHSPDSFLKLFNKTAGV